MRIIMTGDRFWVCPQLAVGFLRRLVSRYGSEIVIDHGGATGVDKSFDRAAKGLGIIVEAHPADRGRLGQRTGPIRNQEMIDDGAGMCLAVHRFFAPQQGHVELLPTDDRGGDTDLPDRQRGGKPVQLHGGDPRLE